MKKLVISFVLFVLLSSPVGAQVFDPAKERITLLTQLVSLLQQLLSLKQQLAVLEAQIQSAKLPIPTPQSVPQVTIQQNVPTIVQNVPQDTTQQLGVVVEVLPIEIASTTMPQVEDFGNGALFCPFGSNVICVNRYSAKDITITSVTISSVVFNATSSLSAKLDGVKILDKTYPNPNRPGLLTYFNEEVRVSRVVGPKDSAQFLVESPGASQWWVSQLRYEVDNVEYIQDIK